MESNQKVEKENSFKKKTVVPEQRERTVRDSKQESSELDTEKGQLYTVHERERTYKITLRKGCQQRTTQVFKQELWHNRVDNEANPEQLQRAADPAMNPTVELHRTKEEAIEEFV